MASREEFSALMRSAQQVGSSGGRAMQQQQRSPKSRPPQAPKLGEQAPLLPPMPQSALPPPGMGMPPRRHGRSHSDVNYLADQSDPSHPFNRTGANRSNRPPRAGSAPQSIIMIPPAPPQGILSPLLFGSPPVAGAPSRKRGSHRRAKSDIPLKAFGGGSSVASGGRLITKTDLLKSLPSPRWGGAPSKALAHTRNRSRTGSDGPFLSDAASVSSGGYGATRDSGGHPPQDHPLLQSVGSVELPPDSKRTSVRHHRTMSDASGFSVTTNLAKSALFKGVTDTGTIQMQLPKDSFRLLMDSQLEAGQVYKRKVVDSENEFFVEFYTVDDTIDPVDACHCTCDGCNKCHEKQKRLPPDLYVMAVDSTIYRRMLDEVIASKTMPCGTFFCGHHEDVRHPDITIAALIVGVVFFLLLAGAVFIWD